jgi:hypothetical protein
MAAVAVAEPAQLQAVMDSFLQHQEWDIEAAMAVLVNQPGQVFTQAVVVVPLIVLTLTPKVKVKMAVAMVDEDIAEHFILLDKTAQQTLVAVAAADITTLVAVVVLALSK